MTKAPKSDSAPIVVWLRRDFRLDDHPALRCAAQSGGPVVPLFVRDEIADNLGAAPRWRLGLAVRRFAATLRNLNSKLVLRSGSAERAVANVARETGARAVFWTREHNPAADSRDARVKRALEKIGVRAESFPGRTLLRPGEVRTQSGGPHKVFTPFWKTMRAMEIPPPVPAARSLTPPAAWPKSENPDDWNTAAAMNRGADIVAKHLRVGEESARARLDEFLSRQIGGYAAGRDFLSASPVSRLSENLAWGEISPRTVWRRARDLPDAEPFLRQLAWREFACHLLFHWPDLDSANWRREWDSFPWRGDNPDAGRWRRGATGVPMVDAAMREMFSTGTMHNRARMIAASFLCKHLLTHWKVGLAWFAECLTDWDPANNALGWQWTAGCGPDAAPYFRVFNPDLQAKKFDPDGAYRRRFVAELSGDAPPPESALDFFRAIPRGWKMSPGAAYPAPAVGLAAGRERALAAFKRWREK